MITEGPDPIFRPRADEPRGRATSCDVSRIPPDARYLLYVGGLSPHKNLIRLVEAFARGAGRRLLVLAGDVHDVFHTHVPEIRAAIAATSI